MEKKVEFKVGRETLRGSLFIPKGKGPFPAVIFFHGSGSTGETYFEAAKRLSEKGILGFAFNFRGYGLSDGKFEDQTIGMGKYDAKAGLEFFLSCEEVDKNRIGLSGSSFGGFWAAMLVSQYRIKSLILSAPAAYASEIMGKRHVDFLDEHNQLRKDYAKSQSYKEIEKFNGDLLVVKCEFDDILPSGMVEKYLESAVSAKIKELYVLKGAKHRISINPKAREALIKKTIEWVLEAL